MKQAFGCARLINIAIIVASCAAATFSDQNPNELNSTARERIEQAGASIVMVKAVDESNQTISQQLVFLSARISSLRIFKSTETRAIKLPLRQRRAR
jgi:hypothetical protein